MPRESNPSQTCRPQDPNGVPTQFSSQNVTDDKLRVTLPSQGMGVFQATSCLEISGRLADFSLFRQVSVITVTVSLQTRRLVRPSSLLPTLLLRCG